MAHEETHSSTAPAGETPPPEQAPSQASPGQQSTDAPRDFEQAQASEFPEPLMPGARVLNRPEGRSERLRISYRSQWHLWLISVVALIAGTAPEWVVERLAGTEGLELLQQHVPADGYQLLMVSLLISGVAVFTLALLLIGYRRLANRYYLYPYSVAQEYGLIARKTSRVSLEDIRTIDVSQSVMQRILGVGDVYFASAGTDAEDVIWRGVVAPMRIQTVVSKRRREVASL